jgi:hypothetical protein
MDLAVQCCGTCSIAAVSKLEEVDLSNNLMSGPPPLSLAKLKASLRKLNLTYNHFEGDYTRLAEIARSFLRADGEAITLTIRPQMPCADGLYANAAVAPQDILPTCTPKPVRLPKAVWRRQAAGPQLCACAQVPTFVVYSLLPQLTLEARKTSKNTVDTKSVAIVAQGVLGPGGINKAWQANGIDSETHVECTNAAPAPCTTGNCTTLWFSSHDCSVLNATHVSIVGERPFSAELAMFNVTVVAPALRERAYRGAYPFALHFPVNSSSNSANQWRFATITGSLVVVAIADPALSDVQIRNPTAPASVPLEGSASRLEISHLDSLHIEICARDVDGHVINRTGEQLLVIVMPVGANGVSNTTQAARYDATTWWYLVLVSITTPGEHEVLLEEVQTGKSARKATLTVVCAAGFVETGQQCLEEASKVQKIVGGTIGAVFLLVGVLGVGLLYKNRARALQFALSFLKREFSLVFKTMSEAWDITGDCMPRRLPSM